MDLVWGLNTDTGRNLGVLAQTSAEQQVFVAFFLVLARAINACGDILCSSAEHAGDDHWLGAYGAFGHHFSRDGQ